MNLFKKKQKTDEFIKEVEKKSPQELNSSLNELIGMSHAMGSNMIDKMMLARLTFKVESSKQFNTSEEQVDSFLTKMPNMTMYRQEIIEKAKKFRKENGLQE